MADLDAPPPTDQQQEELPTTDGTLPEVTPVSDTNGNAEPTNGNGHDSGEKRKPIASWRVMSDSTTSIEVSCWSNTYRNGGGEEYEQLSFTVQRSYKTAEGWTRQERPSWRTHDFPVLMFLMSKAHAFALDRRATTDIPF